MSRDNPLSFEEFIESFALTQAATLALYFVMTEVLHDVARMQPDPKRYLADVFERVMARREQRPIEQWHKGDANVQETLEKLFKHARTHL